MSKVFSKCMSMSMVIILTYMYHRNARFFAKSTVFYRPKSFFSIPLEPPSRVNLRKMHNVSYIWTSTCNLYCVLPYRIDFGALVDTARIQGMFGAWLLRDVSRGLHGFAPFLKDVWSVLHLGKVYFPDFGGCLQRNHYSENPIALDKAQQCSTPPLRIPPRFLIIPSATSSLDSKESRRAFPAI